MTANAFAEDVQLALDSGMNQHIAKPLDARKLYSTISQLLNGRKKENNDFINSRSIPGRNKTGVYVLQYLFWPAGLEFL